MSKWGKTQGDSGILRKAEGPEKIEELLVFGYACKLFRDDEKALEIDQGKHLIPWMGDDSLKIDRYDGRAALSDLSQYEGSTEGYDTARWLGLTDAERRVEQLCDEERYRALHTNEDEEELYREEELKRLHQQLSNEKNYGQVSYNYEATKEEKQEEIDEASVEADNDEPFILPPDFDLPVNMAMPKTVKQNARIEKTALFISQQGAQMEILLKAKQAGNPQFDFLSHDSPLHRYYRHILMAIKSGRYQCSSAQKPEPAPENEDNDHYLHPSLAPVPRNVESAPSIPNIVYKPSADCAYTMLISKIKGTKAVIDDTPETSNSPSVIDTPAQPDKSQTPPTTSTNNSTFNFPPNSTYIYNYVTGKYEPAPTTTNYTDNQYNNVYQQDLYANHPIMAAQYAAYMNNYKSNEIAKSAVIYNKDTVVNTPTVVDSKIEENTVKKEKPKPILPIAHYSGSSDSESDTENDNETQAIINVPAYEVPSSEIQLIIDKMASYVARNGSDFEAIVRSKGDPRFSFLVDSHVYNAYYKHKLKLYGGIVQSSPQPVPATTTTETPASTTVVDEKSNNENEVEEKKSAEVAEKTKSCDKVKKPIAPVSFSIKKAKDPEPVPIERSALPVEESSEESNEENTENGTENVTEDPSNAIVPSIAAPEEESENNIQSKTPPIHSENDEKEDAPPPVKDASVIEIEDAVQELIDLTDDLEERRDAKRAKIVEEKIKDKLAAAAREKMSLLSRNRELQIERKRRAAAFLSKIKPGEVTTLNGLSTSDLNVAEATKTAEEDDLLKRICEFDSEIVSSSSKKSRSEEKDEEKLKHDRNDKYEDKYREKSSRKKRKKRSDDSPDSKRHHHKRSKHSHRSSEKKHSKKKYRSRTRSRSPHEHSRRSRSTSHRSSKSRVEHSSRNKERESSTKKERRKTEKRNEDKSSGEISSPNTSNYCSD